MKVVERRRRRRSYLVVFRVNKLVNATLTNSSVNRSVNTLLTSVTGKGFCRSRVLPRGDDDVF